MKRITSRRPLGPTRATVNTVARFEQNCAALQDLEGLENKPAEPRDRTTAVDILGLTSEERDQLFFSVLLHLAGAVASDRWLLAIKAAQRDNAKLIEKARARQAAKLAAKVCEWCKQGNPRTRSSIAEGVWVHTDTPTGRRVCEEPTS